MTQEAIREIIRRQREFFYTGATLNIDFRIEALKKLQASIQSHQEQIDAALKPCSQRDHLHAEAHPLSFQRKDRAHPSRAVSFQKLHEAISLWGFPDHESLELSFSSHL